MDRPPASLTRIEIRKIFRRHRGSANFIANQLGVTAATISLWLKGKTTSQRIADAACAKALELLERERAESAA